METHRMERSEQHMNKETIFIVLGYTLIEKAEFSWLQTRLRCYNPKQRSPFRTRSTYLSLKSRMLADLLHRFWRDRVDVVLEISSKTAVANRIDSSVQQLQLKTRNLSMGQDREEG